MRFDNKVAIVTGAAHGIGQAYAQALAREGASVVADIDAEATKTVTPGEMVKQIPLSRMGTPEDLVGMCLFLLSDDASWITGQIFNVDGGQVIRS